MTRPADSKPCEVCGELFTRNPSSEGPGRWSARKYCGRDCMGIGRRKPGAKQRKAPAIATAPRPRVENGVWRPNAPGWPAQPRIPARRAS